MANILFIPGIKGTELWEGENKRWFPRNKEDLPSLEIQNQLDPGMPLGKVNAFVVFKNKIYQGIMEAYNQDEIDFYGYDWRQDIRTNVNSLVKRIDQLARKEPVTIVAHSMGGMLSKLAIFSLEEQGKLDRIKKLITVGTPWSGSADAYKVLAYGEAGFYSDISQLREVFDDVKTRSLARQYPSAYQLLPSESYFGLHNCLINSDKPDIELKYSDLVQKVQTFHNEENLERNNNSVIDVWTKYMQPIQREMKRELPVGVVHDCLVGSGFPTLVKVPAMVSQERKNFKNASVFKNGDGTVPILSAIPKHSANIYYAKGQHKNLMSSKDVLDFVKWSVSNKPLSELPSGVVQDEPDHKTELKVGFQAKILCPIDSTILDSEGRYIAGVIDTNIEELSDLVNDESVLYYSIGEAKYLYFGEEKVEDLQVSINSYSTGVAEISVEIFDDNDKGIEYQFDPLPVSKGTSAKVILPLKTKQIPEIQTTEDKIRANPVRKKKNEEIKKFPVPVIRAIIDLAEGTKKVPYNHIYSGPIILSVKADMDKLSNIFYTINGEKPERYLEKVVLDLPHGSHDIQIFGKDIIGRPIKPLSQTITIDNSIPLTKLILDLEPDGLSFNFEKSSFGANSRTYFRVTDSEGKLISKHEDEFGILSSKDRYNLNLKALNKSPHSWIQIEFYTINAFDIKEPLKNVKISLGNIPILMWGDEHPHVTPAMIWENVLKNNFYSLDQFKVKFLGKGLNDGTFSEVIADNVKGVKFESEIIDLKVMYAEKYVLYFIDSPSEITEVGQNYTFSFELRTERSGEKVFGTSPVAKLRRVTGSYEDIITLEVLEVEEGTYRSSFTVDESLLTNKYKLVITDSKNINPPLRVISLLKKE